MSSWKEPIQQTTNIESYIVLHLPLLSRTVNENMNLLIKHASASALPHKAQKQSS